MRLTRLLILIAAALLAVPAAAQQVPESAPFRDEMVKFVAEDAARPAPACPVLFIGSSSIRLWTTLAEDFAPLPVLNRGFGGSTIAEVVENYPFVVAPYRPRAIVFYAGENDIQAGTTPDEAAADFDRFMALKRKQLGDVPVFYISAKPSKARFEQLAAQTRLNTLIALRAVGEPDVRYIDVASAMLRDGAPMDLYVEDRLHMNPAGYAIWRDKVGAALRDSGAAARSCD